MTRSSFSYWKLGVFVTAIAISLIGLSGGSSGTTTAREISPTAPGERCLTRQQQFSDRAATVLATEKGTTTPTLPFEVCSDFGGVKITALERTGILEDKVEVGWTFTMPPQLAALGECIKVEHFLVHVEVFYEGGGSKEKFQHATALSRSEIVRFTSIARKVKRIEVLVQAQYKTIAHSKNVFAKDF